MIKVKKKIIAKQWLAVDGCRNGWVICSFKNNNLELSYSQTIDILIEQHSSILFVDMPIKLPDCIKDYPRYIDKQAKKWLGKYHSSIFYAPLRGWLKLTYNDINKICEENKKPKLSKQSYNIFAKIREIHNIALRYPQRFKEIHPELLYHGYVGNKKLSKKTLDGQHQRLALISKLLNQTVSLQCLIAAKKKLLQQFPEMKCAVDDILDACLMAVIIQKNNVYHHLENGKYIKIKGVIHERINLFF